MHSDTLKSNRRGYVKVWNEAGESVESSNLIVYNGGDIITKLLGGQPEYKIAYMYFAYENTAGAPVPPVPALTDTTALFLGLANPKDFIRSPVLTPPIFTTSDANHLYNRATFLSIANAASGYHSVPFGAVNNSKVYALGLVAAPTGAATGDLLYAHFALPSAVAAAGSGQISATWMVEVV
jgi:hypothetical protein